MDNDELFAALEANVMAWESVEVKFERIAMAFPGRGWQVSFGSRAVGEKRTITASGGGDTMKEAIVNAFADRATRRLMR